MVTGWYSDYLLTAHWLAVREIALYWAGNRCQVCNGTHGLECHHRTYERLGAEFPSDVTVLCQTCHGLFHGRLASVPETDPRDRPPVTELKRPQRTLDLEEDDRYGS